MNRPSTELEREIARRRTFAIISHPDAGKTTLTEKLLLYGGAIHLAGAVRAKRNERHTTSDWMEIERQRGISINTTVLQFEYAGCRINLLDTPGHEDFSEDTYRTLTAADSAVMLIDAARGIEPRTIKLYEVCRLRGLPIFTFVNKLDRPSREPLDLLDEIERVLGIRSCPITWPIGAGDEFRGVYDRAAGQVLFYPRTDRASAEAKVAAVITPAVGELPHDPDDPGLWDHLRAELELLELAGDPYDEARVHAGELTPVFFGSALNNFGVERFLGGFVGMAPTPAARPTVTGDRVEPGDPSFSGFVFKLQANMDPLHRDRVAFLRVCSGKFRRDMTVRHLRLARPLKLSRPLQFFGQERRPIDDAWPGDVIGLVDTSGSLRIGDTLCESGAREYEHVPSFSPEHFAYVRGQDPLKRKQLTKGLEQLAEEGVVQLYRPRDGHGEPVLGAVGALQLDVLRHRLASEYGVDVQLTGLPYAQARWVSGTPFDPTFFDGRDDSRCLIDRDGHFVVLFRNDWALRWAQEKQPDARFSRTAPLSPAARSGAAGPAPR